MQSFALKYISGDFTCLTLKYVSMEFSLAAFVDGVKQNARNVNLCALLFTSFGH